MAEQRAKRLCYDCDETYSMGHKCKKLFWIEVPDYDDEHEGGPKRTQDILKRYQDLQFAYHDDKGLSFRYFSTDSGSTHNFICERLIPQLGLLRMERPGLQVHVANG